MFSFHIERWRKGSVSDKVVYGVPKGEDIEAAALRKLEEETGITVNHIAPLKSDKYLDKTSSAGGSIGTRLL